MHYFLHDPYAWVKEDPTTAVRGLKFSVSERHTCSAMGYMQQLPVRTMAIGMRFEACGVGGRFIGENSLCR